MPTLSLHCIRCNKIKDTVCSYIEYNIEHPVERCTECGGPVVRIIEKGSNVSFQGLPTEKHYK
jgi:predicted nucleic acid-binding Zn ribbon protein